jgi:hypothetical protein
VGPLEELHGLVGCVGRRLSLNRYRGIIGGPHCDSSPGSEDHAFLDRRGREDRRESPVFSPSFLRARGVLSGSKNRIRSSVAFTSTGVIPMKTEKPRIAVKPRGFVRRLARLWERNARSIVHSSNRPRVTKMVAAPFSRSATPNQRGNDCGQQSAVPASNLKIHIHDEDSK